MKKSTGTFLFLPSIICILGIILASLISAFIYFFGDGPRKLSDFLIVFSPTIILLIILFVAWRWQFIGGTILIIVGLVMIIGMPIINIILTHDSLNFTGALTIGFVLGAPIIISGILFRASHFRKKTSIS